MAFRVSAAPYLLLDVDLRIRAANLAYQQATHHHIADMVGEFMFDVFPDNPATPEARSVERLTASFEGALLRGRPDRMQTQRYDVIDRDRGFVRKTWLPVNSPIRDATGKTIGVLHHVEDVTRLVAGTALERSLTAPLDDGGAIGGLGPVDDPRRDARRRRRRAERLIRNSDRAMQRMARRIEADPTRSRATTTSSAARQACVQLLTGAVERQLRLCLGETSMLAARYKTTCAQCVAHRRHDIVAAGVESAEFRARAVTAPHGSARR
ncbi:MAG: PAS domain-containing protein [Jatrophihabitans sp.]|uniref:PAS domain-containing protein n=1 Tax=Jatrophihabitans sp. TaxID=1932789 RepID=UPI003F7FFE5F